MDNFHKRQHDKSCFISLFFTVALLLYQLGIEPARPIHAADGNPTLGLGLENQAELDYTRPVPRTVQSIPAVIPNSSVHLQTLAPAAFVEAENTSQVTYSGAGWSTLACQYCSGGQYRRSQTTGNTATLVFTGTSVSVILVGNARSGIVTIKIDAASYPSINLFNNAAGADPDPTEYVIATNLSPEQHTLQVRVTGEDGYEYRLSADQIGIDGFHYGNFPFGTLRGRVLDPDGDGVVGASLNIASGGQAYSVQAGSDGIFSLSGLPAGTYSVTAFAPNYGPQTLNSIVVTGGSETTGIDIKIPEAAGHALFGRIYTPHSNAPAIQQPGTTLLINVKTGSSATGWSASLATNYKTISLPIVSASYNPVSAWVLQATIPAGTPAELYNLTVGSSLGTDTQVRAVQVVAQYDDPFYFVVLGDPQAATNVPGQPMFEQMVDEINLINPSFVLVVGDLIENGTAPEYEAYQAAINRLQVPSYSVPGNH
ncbi:MAG: carboxypeptidase regulatory-like domain-containing protein, partial [Chloroflexi bacterium]|nr:carboxypeptidase regulatory-like domain-containing protein [Chloroflexota bacterium]